MNRNYLTLALGGLASLMLLGSCQDEDFGFSSEQIKKSQFAKNFEDEYGAIDPDQSWDLTRSMVRTWKYEPFSFGDSQTRSAIAGYEEAPASAIATYPAGSSADNYAAWYEVQDETLTWFNETLTEGVNHTSVGKPFSLIAPANGFAIIPIFQGEAGMDWQLHVVDKTAGKDYTIWSESQGMVRRENDSQPWSTIPTECHYNDGGLIKDQSSATFGYKIKSQPIQLNITAGHELFLYLKVVKGQWKSDGYGDGNYAKTGTEQRSDAGMMLALECPIPSNVGNTGGQGNLAMIIGCEDADGLPVKDENGNTTIVGSDWDMNDVCFLVVGYPNIPDRISYTQKRYMCEDLGNTYDFDFNDIVIDVTEATYYSAVSTPIVKDGKQYVNFQRNESKTKQYATITHVCGTLPFQVKVGNYEFPIVEDPTDEAKTKENLGASVTRGVNWNPNVTKEISGWNSSTDNIEIYVAKDNNNKNIDVLKEKFTNKGSDGTVENENESDHIYKINFPARGKAPLIIAVDPTIGWMDEHVHIPEAWWKEGKVFEQNAGSGEDSQHGSDMLSMEVTSLPWNDYRQLSYGNGIANNLILMPTCFYTMAVGDVISFTTTGDLNLHYANPAGWETISSGKNYAAGSNNEPGVVTLKITDATMLQNLKQYGLGINGDKVIVTHIESYTPKQYTLKVTAGDHGMISVDGGDFVMSFNQSVDEGAHTIKAKADKGYALDKWSDEVTTKSRMVNLSANLELSVSFTESDYINLWEGEKNSDWNNPEFRFEQDQKFNAGDKIIFTGEGTSNFRVKFGNNWDPTAIPSTIETGFEITLTQQMANVLNSDHFFRITDVNGSLSITSIDLLPPAQYTINVATANAEQGTVEIVGQNGATTYTGVEGNVSIKATPAEHYKFVSWSKGGSVVENAGATYNFTLSEATAGTYTANFAEAAKVSITASSNNDSWGTVNTTGGEYYEGTSVTLTATATNEGVFVKWTKDGNDAGTEATLNLTASTSSAGVYQAVFRAKESYSVTLAVGENGTATIDTQANAAEGKYYEGTEVTFTANPAVGYKVAHWKKNGVTIDGATKNTLTITVSENATYSVEFEETKEATGETTLSPSGNYYRFSAMSNISEQATKLTLTLTFVNNVNGVVGILDGNNNITSTVQFGYSTTSPLNIEITNSALISAAKSGDLYMASYSNAGDISKIEYKAE